jgi:hypothetical protein
MIAENYINITTFTQLKYWLELGEIIVLEFDDGDGYLTKNEDEIILVMNSRNNTRQSESKGSWNKLKELFKCLNGVDMFVIKGAKLQGGIL